MRVSLTWLKELVDVTLPVDELCERLDMTGTKVEAVHTLGAALDGVVVGQVITKEQHPDADRLSYCSVDVGADEPLNIVCGATNFEAGDKVPVAQVGTTLPGGVTIKRAKLRGLVSEGMMCSPTEIEVGGDGSGLLILDPDAPVGEPFAEYYGIADTVLELEVTPNRPDCLSMVGVAREVAAVTGATFTVPASAPVEEGAPAADLVSVEIEDGALCPRYTARVIRGVKVGPSPAWLAERVAAAGARPVNNVVDVTNYILFELGQPLHAFDLATLAKRDGVAAVTVRVAREDETIRTLDGQERRLASDTLLITDDDGPVALAGVMGGEETEVSEATTDILLESACFDTASISRTSRRLGLISESSLRYERGVDPDLASRASDRAAALIAEVAGGTVAPGLVDAYPGQRAPLQLRLRTGRVNALLGTDLDTSVIATLLRPLGLSAEGSGDELEVVVPGFRPDLEREVDLIEEVARLYGLENITSTLPGGGGRIGGRTSRQRFVSRIGSVLRAAGLDEHVGYSFGDPADLDRLGWELASDELLVELINPMSEEQAVMRWTLAPSLLRALSHNQRRGIADVHLYEMGTVFVTSEGRKQPKERLMAAGVLAGSWVRPGWNEQAPGLDFFDGKGVLASLLEALGVERWSVRAAERPWLQPGRTAEVIVRGDVIGWLGEVSADVLERFDASGPATLFEISVPALLKAASKVTTTFKEIPRHPAAALDLALVVPEDVTSERVVSAIESAGGALLESVRLFDVYRDPEGVEDRERRLPEGTKSLAFSLTYRAPDRTLSDADVRPVHDKLVRKVCAAVGGEVRG
ncbi:MAG TPA: phenylalanine--tRNA ligase subunit beta [Coriobacteriia bacterium]|nr:MAG: Phenylalanine--tRNA ligase beta subunit [Actinobacteria bacterium 66_15]HAL29216.1 phenylalanine--tRNA ligase subunit beta [Coriobacteriia bacterium]